MRFRGRPSEFLRSRRGAATEYVILFILTALTAVLLYSKYGRTVGGKVDVAGNQVGALGRQGPPVADGGDTQGAGRAGSNGAAAGGGNSGGGGTIGGGSGGGGGDEETRPDKLPARVDNHQSAEARAIDLRTIVLLGIFVLAAGIAMILAIAQRVAKDRKKAKARR